MVDVPLKWQILEKPCLQTLKSGLLKITTMEPKTRKEKLANIIKIRIKIRIKEIFSYKSCCFIFNHIFTLFQNYFRITAFIASVN